MTKLADSCLCYKRFTATRAMFAFSFAIGSTSSRNTRINHFDVTKLTDGCLCYKRFATLGTFTTFGQTCFSTSCIFTRNDRSIYMCTFCVTDKSTLVTRFVIVVCIFVRLHWNDNRGFKLSIAYRTFYAISKSCLRACGVISCYSNRGVTFGRGCSLCNDNLSTINTFSAFS